MNYNRCILAGNLTRDVEIRRTRNNTAIATFGLAVNRRFKDAAGGQQEETCFVDCEAWGRTGETISKYLRRGDPLHIEGRLKLDQWKDKQGNPRNKIKVVVEGFQFCGGPRGKTDNPQPQQSASYPRMSEPAGPAEDDDIPF